MVITKDDNFFKALVRFIKEWFGSEGLEQLKKALEEAIKET